jgi:hypothetical protein
MLKPFRVSFVTLATIVTIAAGMDGIVTDTAVAAPRNLVANPAMEQIHSGFPACFEQGGYGIGSATYRRVASGHRDSTAAELAVGELHSGDRKLITRQDAGRCAPEVIAGHQYRASLLYRATAPVRLALYYRSIRGRWLFWMKSPYASASSAWKGLSLLTPPIPAGASRLSFGVSLANPGTVITDDYALVDTAKKRVLFSKNFSGSDGLITNEYAYWNRGRPDTVPSRDWEMTSGSLWRQNSSAYTGRPDAAVPDAQSIRGNNSAIFRLTTKRSDFNNVAVRMQLKNDGLIATERTPAVDWDGVHVFLRYKREDWLYYASVNRRDNTVAVKKKVPGGPSNGGTYFTLATGKFNVRYGVWQNVSAQIRTDRTGSVLLSLWVDGSRLIQAKDDGSIGGPPITGPGAVGIRGDNATFCFDDFVVSSI